MHHELTGRRQLGFETLEDRQMLAGNVTAEFVGDDLVVTGDRFANEIELHDNGVGVDVKGVNGTKIDGVTNGTESFGQVPGNLRIRMRGGNDSLAVNDIGVDALWEADGSTGEVQGRMIIVGGYGRDEIVVQSPDDVFPVINGLSVYGGPADDCVKLVAVDVADSPAATDLYIHLAGGNDTLVIDPQGVTGAVFRGNSVINAGAGHDQVRMRLTLFFSADMTTRVLLGAGNDRLALQDAYFSGNFRAIGGNGRDQIGIMMGTEFHGDVLINGNRGRDKIFADTSVLGDGIADKVDILGGLQGDWLGAIRSSTFNGTTRIRGGRGFDNGFDDRTNTFNGPFMWASFEGTNPPPDLEDLIDELLAIDC